jgi:hypothetical protein
MKLVLSADLFFGSWCDLMCDYAVPFQSGCWLKWIEASLDESVRPLAKPSKSVSVLLHCIDPAQIANCRSPSVVPAFNQPKT